MGKHVITGATGFLGQHVVDAIQSTHPKAEIVALVRTFNDRLDSLGVEQIEGDFENIDALHKLVSGADFVYHLAGRVERDADQAHTMYALHVDGTRRLLDALVGTEVKKVVVASTSGTVGVSQHAEDIANDFSPMAENVVRNWPYYLSKIYAERVCDRYVREHELPIVQLRPTLLLGPGDDRRSSTKDVENFLNGKIPTTPPGGLSFVDARDVAKAFVSAADVAEPGSKYLLGSANMTMDAFFELLEEISGVTAPKWQVPQAAALFSTRLADSALKMFNKRSTVDPVSVEMAGHFWYIDWSRAERELGFSPRDPKLTLRDTVKDIVAVRPNADTPPSFVSEIRNR